uniref:Uncharacterized protein n=1 Tax=Helianthus annuus TaxID=4232 RepID=A0A251V1G4_HELAN
MMFLGSNCRNLLGASPFCSSSSPNYRFSQDALSTSACTIIRSYIPEASFSILIGSWLGENSYWRRWVGRCIVFRLGSIPGSIVNR